VCRLDVIPTFVTEMGDSLMDEISEAEMMTAVESLESDQWSSTSSSPGELTMSA